MGQNSEFSESELIEAIRESEFSGLSVETKLETDERVIARVTDGIYRRPGSALRELISNAFDADARIVRIRTDRPRFQKITIEDDGIGMSPEVLAHLIKHIGGSAKRVSEGIRLGVTSRGSADYSPGGRRLIGKIGIGLFSVSQLTQSFQVITKQKGESFRTVATVALRQYSDKEVHGSGERFESGRVRIWREKAEDISTQGTTIVLNAVRPQAIDILQSRDKWDAVDQQDLTGSDTVPLDPPKFHIGRVGSDNHLYVGDEKGQTSLPWNAVDEPQKAFKKLVEAVWGEVGKTQQNPKLEFLLDSYLLMAWQLALAVPVRYVDEHLFGIHIHDWARVFKLTNKSKGSSDEVVFDEGESIASKLAFEPRDFDTDFRVFLDDLELLRPIEFKKFPSTLHAITQPLVFLDRISESFEKVPVTLSGGPLIFDAYLVWAPKIVPREHQGVLVRINGASGTLFDNTFFRYQTAEVFRLQQISCEIFVHEGLDSALNIDRESFNSAHPHTAFLTKWLHRALRQVANTGKKIASEIRANSLEFRTEETIDRIDSIVRDVWQRENDAGSAPPNVVFSDYDNVDPDHHDTIYLPKRLVEFDVGERQTPVRIAKKEILEKRIASIVKILASYGLMNELSKSKQVSLIESIRNVLSLTEDAD